MNILAISVMLMVTLTVTACTSLRTIESTPEALQGRLRSGELLQPGDRVRLVTRDETVHEFRVTKIDLERGFVIGRDDQVPIDEIVALETREVSIGKTALLVGGVGYSLITLMLILAAPAVILSGG